MKKSVSWILVFIVLVSVVSALEIPWPSYVPYGKSYHQTLYTDEIKPADNNLIWVNTSLNISGVMYGNGSGIYGLNLTNQYFGGNTIFEGDTTTFINNVEVGGNLSVDENLTVSNYIYGDTILSEYINVTEDIVASNMIINNNLNATNIFTSNISAEYYCDEDLTNCTTLEEILSLSSLGLLDVLNENANASGYTDKVEIGGSLNVGNPFTVWSGEINNSNYLEINYDDGNDLFAIQSNKNIRISGAGAEDLTELKLGAETTNVSGDLTVGGNVGIGTTSPGAILEVNAGGTLTTGPTQTPIALFLRGQGGDNYIAIYGDASGNYIVADDTGTNQKPLRLQTKNNMNILLEPHGTGKVGIGITNPGARLEIQAGDNYDGGRFKFGAIDTGSEEEGFFRMSNDNNGGLMMRSDVNAPKIGAYNSGELQIYPFSSITGDLDTVKGPLTVFDFGNMQVDLKGDVVIQNGNSLTLGGVTKTGWPEGYWEESGSNIKPANNAALDINNQEIINIDWSMSDDGSGSGLDADLLDGLNSTSFLTSEIGDISEVIAGNGLMGGGASGDVTLTVGAGTGISVAADTVSLNTAYTDGRYMRLVSDGNYDGMKDTTGSTSQWIRTTTNGIIPKTSNGDSSLGTSGWPFANVYANNIYLGGNNVATQAWVISQGYSNTTGDITSVTAGSGLTGGGDSGDVTLTVGAGTGISVDANSISATLGITIEEGEIVQNSLDDSEIQDNSLTASSLAADSVGTSEVIDNNLTASDLAADSVGNSELVNSITLTNLEITNVLELSRSMDQIKFTTGTDDWWWMSKPGDDLAFAVYSPSTDGGSYSGFIFNVEEDGDVIVSGNLTVSGSSATLPASTTVGGESVCLEDGTDCPNTGGDNLGDHQATQNLDLNQKNIIDGDTIYMDNWYRSYGNTGWYSQDYDGGWHMSDSTWIRSYGSKPVYVNKHVRADDGFQVDGNNAIDSSNRYHYSTSTSTNKWGAANANGFGIDALNSGDWDFLVYEGSIYLQYSNTGAVVYVGGNIQDYNDDTVNIGENLGVAGDLTVSGGDIKIDNNNNGIHFSDQNKYWLQTGSSNNWGLYWDTSTNQLSFRGAGTDRANIDLDNGNMQMDGDLTVSGGDITGAGNAKLDIGEATASDFTFYDTTDDSEYVEFNCRDSNSDALCQFNTGLYVSGGTFYANNDIYLRGPITNDDDDACGGDICLNEDTTVNGDLTVSGDVDGALTIGVGGDAGRIWTEYKNGGPAIIMYDFDDVGGGIYFREGPTSGDENNPDYEAYIVGKRGKVGIGTTSPGYTLEVAGSVSADAFYYSSDRRLKKNINVLQSSLDKITDLQGIEFNWKDDKDNTKKQLGLIAQDVEKVYPELVSTNEEGMKSLQYANLVAPLIESVKELKEINENQSQEIDELRKELEELKEEVK